MSYFISGDNDGAYVATVGDLVVSIDGSFLCVMAKDADGNNVVVGSETVRSYGEPFYSDLAGFVAFCKGCCKAGIADTNVAGRILYIFDHRPEREITVFPDGKRIPDEDRGYYEGGNFGYAFNIDYPYMSEWGYAHAFPKAGENDSDMLKRQQQEYNNVMAFLSEIGGGEEPFVVDAGVRYTGTAE